MHLKMSFKKCQPFRSGFNVLNEKKWNNAEKFMIIDSFLIKCMSYVTYNITTTICLKYSHTLFLEQTYNPENTQ